ncbi:hypothetical protein IFM89_022532 [Coptis chinensis]|uniref:Uncharacterized protein n=1 Tax=Coptis chinensis TaxID=261450 RepID=A0A835IQ80_9MAGN|nr:hypothetical protein IFM89_022532 [Coptis chinensis]
MKEAALYVVNNKSSEEALSIFTEGMEQVMTSVGNEKRNLITEQDGDVEYQNMSYSTWFHGLERCCFRTILAVVGLDFDIY